MSNLSRLIKTVALLTLAAALSSCASFVTNTQKDILERPTAVNWKLQKSSDNKVLQCITGDISICDENPRSLVSEEIISTESRIEILHSLNSTNPVTLASVENGYTSLRELASSVKSTGTKMSGVQLALQAKFNASPETLFLFAQLLHLVDVADSSKPRSDASMSSVAGAKSAMKALIHNDACVELDKIRHNSTGASESYRFTISKESFRNCLDLTRDATTLDGWSALSAHYVSIFIGEANKIAALGTIEQAEQRKLTVLMKEAVAASLIGSYMKAYFNNGSIFAVSLTVGKLKKDAIEALKRNFYKADQTADADTDKAIEDLADKLLQQIVGSKPEGDTYHLLVKKDSGGFVTRAGATHVFPGISVTVNPRGEIPVGLNKIDLAQVGSDMIRVLIEGLGDGWAMVPGDPKSTGVSVGLPPYSPPVSGKKGVTADEFVAVNDWGNKVEGVVGGAVGQAIRGISWISLNNEALAKMIETAAGVAARKGTEKLAWCFYACRATGRTIKGLEALDVNSVEFAVGN